MHPAAHRWVQRHAPDGPVSVVECGSRDINGTVRDCFNASSYVGVDLHEGPAVDVVADWLTYQPDALVDVVVHCEVAEHTPDWPAHLAHAASMLEPGGRLIFTAAGPGRGAHSAIDGLGLRPSEHYRNIEPDELAALLEQHYSDHLVDVDGQDIRAVAWR